MPRLDLFEGLGMVKLEIRAASLHRALCRNEMLPRLPQLDVRGRTLQRLEDGDVVTGAEHRAMIRDDPLRAPLGRQRRQEELQERW
jgi:hypothetical protein